MPGRRLIRAALAAATLTGIVASGACGEDDGETSASASPGSHGPEGLEEAEWGEQLFRSHGCTACHTITGSRSVGGPLDGLIGKKRPLEDGTEVVADPQYLRRAIVDPQAEIVEGYPPQMPSYEEQLTDAEVQALVAYLRSLR